MELNIGNENWDGFDGFFRNIPRKHPLIHYNIDFLFTIGSSSLHLPNDISYDYTDSYKDMNKILDSDDTNQIDCIKIHFYINHMHLFTSVYYEKFERLLRRCKNICVGWIPLNDYHFRGLMYWLFGRNLISNIYFTMGANRIDDLRAILLVMHGQHKYRSHYFVTIRDLEDVSEFWQWLARKLRVGIAYQWSKESGLVNGNRNGFARMISCCRMWMLCWKFGDNKHVSQLPRDIALLIGRVVWSERYNPVFYIPVKN